MNKNQVKGVTTDIAGKVQEEAGKLVGSKEQQIKRFVQADFRQGAEGRRGCRRIHQRPEQKTLVCRPACRQPAYGEIVSALTAESGQQAYIEKLCEPLKFRSMKSRSSPSRVPWPALAPLCWWPAN